MPFENPELLSSLVFLRPWHEIGHNRRLVHLFASLASPQRFAVADSLHMLVEALLLSGMLLVLRHSAVYSAYVGARLRFLLGCGKNPPLCDQAQASLLQVAFVSALLARCVLLRHIRPHLWRSQWLRYGSPSRFLGG
jgi:hypothetical protein